MPKVLIADALSERAAEIFCGVAWTWMSRSA